MDDVTRATIFISCPKDVDPEKALVKNILAAQNDILRAAEIPLIFQAVEWSSSVFPRYGVRAQEQITQQIGRYDMFLGLLWMRFGTPSGAINPKTGKPFSSGTEEEFVIAQNRLSTDQPDLTIKFYFKQPVPLTGKHDPDQFEKVSEFKKNFRDNHEWVEQFEHEIDFERLFTKYLNLFSLKIQSKLLLPAQSDDAIFTTPHVVNFLSFKANGDYISRTIAPFPQPTNTRNPFLKQENINSSLKEVVTTQNRIVVLGHAGTGKSELLKHTALDFEKENIFVPIYISLSQYVEQSLEQLLPDGWERISDDRLILFLDGLDEVPINQLNNFIRKLEFFGQSHSEMRIVVSCRNNFYNLPSKKEEGTIRNFIPYFIVPLNGKDVQKYVGEDHQLDATRFMSLLDSLGIYDLAHTPFFLSNLVTEYSNTGKLPATRGELMEDIIKNNSSLDQNHFRTKIEVQRSRQIKLLERISIGMEGVGRNQISNDELEQIIPDHLDLEIVKHNGLFGKLDNNQWGFSHKNFQEYLAAKALSKHSFKEIKQIIFFKPGLTKLIPTWQNTISFLFSIINKSSSLAKELVKHLAEYSPETLLRVESDRVSLPLREKIFKSIFSRYRKQDIWLNSSKFTIRELTKFSNSGKSIAFILKEFGTSSTRINKINALQLIQSFEIPKRMRSKTIEALFKLIEEPTEDNLLIHEVLDALANDTITSTSICDQMVERYHSSHDPYIRTALYDLIYANKRADKHIGVIIEGYHMMQSDKGLRGRINLASESWMLSEVMKQATSVQSTLAKLKFISQKKSWNDLYDGQSILDNTIANAVENHAVSSKIFNAVFSVYKLSTKIFYNNEGEIIAKYFTQTGTNARAFDQLWNETSLGEYDKTQLIYHLLNPTLINTVLERFTKRQVSIKEIEPIYFIMRFHRDSRTADFGQQIQNIEPSFTIPAPVDSRAIETKRVQESFDLLFSPEDMKSRVIEFVSKMTEEDLSVSNLTKLRFNEVRRSQNLVQDLPDVVFDLLLQLARNKEILNPRNVDAFVNSEKRFEWYRISTIYEDLNRHATLQLNNEQKNYVTAWASEITKHFKFETAVTRNDNGRISIKWAAVYVWYFVREHDITVSEEILLDMLAFEWHDRKSNKVGIQYIIDRVGKEKVKARILTNIKKKNIDQEVLQNYVTFVAKNNVIAALPFVIKELLNRDRESYERTKYIDELAVLPEFNEELPDILAKVDQEVAWHIATKFISDGNIDSIKPYLKRRFKSKLENVKIKAAELLIKIQDIEALKYVAGRVIAKESLLREDSPLIHAISDVKTTQGIPPLMELLLYSSQKRTGDPFDKYDDLNRSVLHALSTIGVESAANLKLVKVELSKFINKHLNKLPDIRFIHFTIERMEQQYYYNKSQQMDMTQVLDLLKERKILSA